MIQIRFKQMPSTLPVRIACLIALPALVSASGQAHAQSPAAARQAIQARYDQFNRAYMQKDFVSVGNVFAPGCMLKLQSENRSMKAPRAVQGMRTMSRSLTVAHAKTHILSIQPQGTDYTVSAVWTGDSSYTPVGETQDDRPRSGRTQQAYQDTWKKTGTGWQIIQRVIKE